MYIKIIDISEVILMVGFPELKKKLAFGCMRLPMIKEEVDIDQFTKMVDRFLMEGFNYFDTARPYINGRSELAIKEALTRRYPRDRFILTDKLTGSFFKKKEDIRPLFQSQLDACGVDYFDFYLMHAQNAQRFEEFKKCKAYETAFQLKKEGKIRHVGISFHDTAEVLDRILTEYPEIEVVQIQFNYFDYDNKSVDSKGVYEVCLRHDKPIFIMEPVKGGSLINLPKDAKRIFDSLNSGSYASYAIRFAAGFANVTEVLSGMSDLEQLEDNMSYMKDFRPLSDIEQDAIIKVREIFHRLDLIQCTSCRYCIQENHCPKQIKIPNLFSCLNQKTAFGEKDLDKQYSWLTQAPNGKASDCIKCGMCEKVCPQHLPIRNLLERVSREFEK